MVLAVLEQTWLWIQVVFGVGLMIFIHELGHFLAAKKVGVRVDTFSLGFGTRLFGFKKGDTDYRISLIPLGGYVKLAGENPGEENTGSSDELCNRTPGERMLIFVAGVVMNFLFAFIAFPIIFAVGIPFVIPEIGRMTVGGPAWKAGLEPGDKILEVNGNAIYQFSDIHVNIALGNKEGNELLVERDGKQFTVVIKPEKDKQQGLYQIQIASATRFQVRIDEGDSPALRAGLKQGDRVVSINGIPVEDWVTQGQEAEAGRPLHLAVERVEEGTSESVYPITLVPEEAVAEDRRLIGIEPLFNRVKSLRGELAEKKNGLLPGDFIVDLNGSPIHTQSDFDGGLKAVHESAEDFVFQVDRGESRLKMTYGPEWYDGLQNDLAVEQNLEARTVCLIKGGALESLDNPDLGNGMAIEEVNGVKTESFSDISRVVQESSSDRFELTVRPPEMSGLIGTRTVYVTALPQQYTRLGFDFLPALQIKKLSLVDAISAGIHSSLYMIKTCYLTLSRILTGDVAGKNLGGIITIGRATYSFAELGLAKLFFFLAILSINLGFLNILPIPVLDGGHLFFLLIEKIKGSPVNEKIMGYSQVVGLVLILALLVYVTYNDILRLIY